MASTRCLCTVGTCRFERSLSALTAAGALITAAEVCRAARPPLLWPGCATLGRAGLPTLEVAVVVVWQDQRHGLAEPGHLRACFQAGAQCLDPVPEPARGEQAFQILLEGVTGVAQFLADVVVSHRVCGRPPVPLDECGARLRPENVDRLHRGDPRCGQRPQVPPQTVR